jgi:hypothetical protein
VDNAYLPLGFGGGLQYTKSSDFLVAADFYYRKWSDLKYFNTTNDLNNYISGGIGMQWSPKGGDYALRGFSNYLKTVQFRLGAKYAQMYYPGFDKQPLSMSFTAGLGLPVGTKGSAVDISVEAGQLGDLDNNGIREQFFKLSLGLHIFDDTWFKRRKIE